MIKRKGKGVDEELETLTTIPAPQLIEENSRNLHRFQGFTT